VEAATTSAAMKTAASATTGSASAAVTTTVLGECRVRGKGKTNESGKYDEESMKTESAHIQPPFDYGSAL